MTGRYEAAPGVVVDPVPAIGDQGTVVVDVGSADLEGVHGDGGGAVRGDGDGVGGNRQAVLRVHHVVSCAGRRTEVDGRARLAVDADGGLARGTGPAADPLDGRTGERERRGRAGTGGGVSRPSRVLAAGHGVPGAGVGDGGGGVVRSGTGVRGCARGLPDRGEFGHRQVGDVAVAAVVPDVPGDGSAGVDDAKGVGDQLVGA